MITPLRGDTPEGGGRSSARTISLRLEGACGRTKEVFDTSPGPSPFEGEREKPEDGPNKMRAGLSGENL